MNAPRMRNALTMLYISHQGPRGDPWYEIYRMSKAALVRGAFAIQCRNPESQSFLQSYWRVPDSQSFIVILCRSTLQFSAHYRYPQSFPQSVAAVIACSHYQSPIVKYGTVERSDLAKCRQDDLCCRRTIRRWNPEARGFRLMYGTLAADEKNFIHTPVSAKSSVSIRPCTLY